MANALGITFMVFKCLLCGHAETDLVRIQEHAMNEHNVTQKDLSDSSHVWNLPDGRPWLRAERIYRVK